ncbi:MAG: hypothetical protein ACYDBH_25065, partial [Acidobacteriaceae bacterium]
MGLMPAAMALWPGQWFAGMKGGESSERPHTDLSFISVGNSLLPGPGGTRTLLHDSALHPRSA